MRGLPDRILRRPSVSLLRSAIPVGDDIIHIASEDRVVRLVEEARLLLQGRRGVVGLHGENCRQIIARQISGFAVPAGLPLAGGESM
jgi:hypothetical protein